MEQCSNKGYSRVSGAALENSTTSASMLRLKPAQNGPKLNHSDKPKTIFSSDNARHFNSKDQTRRLFAKQIFRWLATAIIIAFVLATFRIYERKGPITPAQKVTFNIIQTALSLALSLNFFDAFKDQAKVLRWRILARKHHSIREVDLILGFEDWVNVAVLGLKSLSKPWTLISCSAWILLMIIAQTSVALINLTYSINDGTDWKGTYTRKGIVKATNLTCYFQNQACPTVNPQVVSQAQAHAYGNLPFRSECVHYDEVSDVLNSREDYTYYCRRTPNRQEFAYRFKEYNPDDRQEAYPWFTNRIISASSGRCFEYSEVASSLGFDTNGILDALNYEYTNGSFNGNISIPISNGALGGTTYIYRGTDIPQRATVYSCGPRCIWMWAHKNVGAGEESTFYQCPITVSPVNNTTQDAHIISDDVARLAASAIGLEGRSADNNSTQVWTQFQFYAYGTAWEIHGKRTDEVGAFMAEFAISSIATMATKNLQVQIEGTVPYLGSRVKVYWPYVFALFACIAGVHLALLASAIYASRLVVIKADSNLSTARLLRPLVDKLGSSGTILNGEEVSRAIQEIDGYDVVYGPRDVEGSNDYYLDIGDNVSPRARLTNRRHPDGTYL